MAEPVVEELVEVRELAPGDTASRALICRWSDGTASEAVRFVHDETALTEGDLVGRTASGIRVLLHRRDVDYLQRDDGRPDDAQPFLGT